MALRTRRPTGIQPYPFTVAAGTPSAGKTYTLIQGSASPLVGESYVLTLGEESPDSFQGVAGSDFQMVEHDGTYDDILTQIREVKALPRIDDRPNYFAFDGGTALYNLIRSQAQTIANQRAALNAKRTRSAVPVGDVKLTGDLWELIRDQWNAVIAEMRTMDGPSAMSVRLEEKTVSINGVETAEKVWRMRAGDNLQYDATVVVEMVRRGDYVLTKRNSPGTGFRGDQPWRDFTLDALWRDMGIGTEAFGVRSFEQARLDPSLTSDKSGRDWIAELSGVSSTGVRGLLAEAEAAHASQDVLETIRSQVPRTVTPE